MLLMCTFPINSLLEPNVVFFLAIQLARKLTSSMTLTPIKCSLVVMLFFTKLFFPMSPFHPFPQIQALWFLFLYPIPHHQNQFLLSNNPHHRIQFRLRHHLLVLLSNPFYVVFNDLITPSTTLRDYVYNQVMSPNHFSSLSSSPQKGM